MTTPIASGIEVTDELIVRTVARLVRADGAAAQPTADGQPSLGRQFCIAAQAFGGHETERCKQRMTAFAEFCGVDTLHQLDHDPVFLVDQLRAHAEQIAGRR